MESSNFSRRAMLKLGTLAALGCVTKSEDSNKDKKIMNYNFSEIIKRSIPSSGEKIPVIGLGTWQTFNVDNSEEERTALREVSFELYCFNRIYFLNQ